MTSTYFQRKRSEHGASLILLVSIIGLAFIVTVAAFLVAASNGQDTARLASAKVDIATREDALMRVILQQTATGMLPGTDGVTGPILTWTGLMSNAVNQLRATTYVNPTEVTTLQSSGALPAGVIPANMGDTGGTLLGLFQGYSQEVPFGGTSGLANVVNPYNSTVQPPLMNWSGGTTLVPLSAGTALTTPQEFFLGSQYAAGVTASVTKLSISNRWGQILYPAIRFGYKQPGDQFIARRVWWRIPLLYQTAQQTLEDQVGVNRYPSAPANYVLSVYEIPSQLPISGNANLQIGLNSNGTAWGSGIVVSGSIYGGQIQLSGGTYNKGVSSRQQVNVLGTAMVGGTPYATSANNLFDQPGTRETMALYQTPGAAAPISVAGNDGKVLLVPVMPGNQFYMSVAPTSTAPTHWDLYARPYYRCRIRVIISGTDANLIYNSQTGVTTSATGTGAITVTITVLSDAASQQDQILGFPDSSAATPIVYSQKYNGDPTAIWPAPSYMYYTSTGTGTGAAPTGSDRNILVIDVLKMVQTLGSGQQAQLYSIYVGSNPNTEPAIPSTSSDPGIGITDTHDLSTFSPHGLSIVTNQTLYLLDSFNQGAITPPTSLYAPQILYGMSGALGNVALTGQISLDPISSATPKVNPVTLSTATGTLFTPNLATLSEITDPTLIPPITRMSLMFTIEKERTN
jgi:hypothetical protein